MTLTDEELELYRQAKREQYRKYRTANREKLNAYQREYRRTHPEKTKEWEDNRKLALIERQKRLNSERA